MTHNLLAFAEQTLPALRNSKNFVQTANKLGTILLIEDEVDLNLALAIRLRNAGFQVVSAYDGIKGLERGLSVEPDLILLDLRLPRMHGFKVLHRLKMSPATNHIPIVIITGDPDSKIDEKANHWGIKHVYRKPIPQRQLVDSVIRIVNGTDEE